MDEFRWDLNQGGQFSGRSENGYGGSGGAKKGNFRGYGELNLLMYIKWFLIYRSVVLLDSSCKLHTSRSFLTHPLRWVWSRRIATFLIMPYNYSSTTATIWQVTLHSCDMDIYINSYTALYFTLLYFTSSIEVMCDSW